MRTIITATVMALTVMALCAVSFSIPANAATKKGGAAKSGACLDQAKASCYPKCTPGAVKASYDRCMKK